MTKTLYLHIGTFKTGTSSLQRFLHDHRDWLREQGCLVPDSKLIGHHPLAQSIVKDFSDFYPPGWAPLKENYKILWKQFHEEVERTDCPVVLLSSECFCDLAHENCRQQTDTMMHWLAEQLGGLDVRVVSYLRPVGAYAKSFYKELIKITNHNRTLAAQLDQQVANRSIHVSPTAYLDFYAEHFGAGNLILRQYDRHTLVNGNTIDDFLEVIGLPPQANNAGGEYNPSLPDGLIDAKRTFNALTESSIKETRRVGRAMAQQASASALGRPADGGQTIRDALQREHDAIAEHYGLDLGEAGDPFSDSSDRPDVDQGSLILTSMLYKEVRDLRARVEELTTDQASAETSSRPDIGRRLWRFLRRNARQALRRLRN